jgi:hypothetical protein
MCDSGDGTGQAHGMSMVDRRLHDDLRKIYLRLKAPRFDLQRRDRASRARPGEAVLVRSRDWLQPCLRDLD